MRRLLIACFICVLVFSGCKDKEKIVDSDNLESINDTSVSSEVVEEVVGEDGVEKEKSQIETEKAEIIHVTKEDILGHWEVEKATYKSTGKELPLQYLYGTGIGYGGGVDFFEDGITDENIGITSDEGGDVKITYTIENGIIKVWVNGKVIREYEYIENAEKTCLRSLRDDYFSEEYYLYFEREYYEVLPRVTALHQKEYIVKKGEKYGLISEDKQMIFRCIYDDIKHFRGDVYIIKYNDKYALWRVSSNLNDEPAFSYDELKGTWIERDYSKLLIVKMGKWYKLIYEGNTFVPLLNRYEYLEDTGKFFIAKKDGNYGMISTYEVEIFPFEYEDLQCGETDVHGFVLEAGTGTYIAKKNGKYGVIDEKQNVIIPYEYDKIKFSNYGVEVPLYYKVMKNGKWGMINLENKLVIPMVYDEIDIARYSSVCRVRMGDKWGAIDLHTFTQTIPCKYSKMESMSRGGWNEYAKDPMCKVSEDGKLWGIMDSSDGSIVIECAYDEIKSDDMFSDTFLVKKNSKWGIADSEGELVVNFKYDSIDYCEEYNNTVCITKLNNKFGLIRVYDDGSIYDEVKTISECIYDEVRVGDKHSSFIVKLNSKWGVIYTWDTKLKTDVKYDEIEYYEENEKGCYVVRFGNKYGIIEIGERNLAVECSYSNKKDAIDEFYKI